MDGKDIERLIEAAKTCDSRINCIDCPGTITGRDCILNGSSEAIINKITGHYENLLIKQSEFNDRVNGQLIQDRWDERSRVIAEVMEWVSKNQYGIHHDYRFEVDYAVDMVDLLEKLDSMEPDKGEPQK